MYSFIMEEAIQASRFKKQEVCCELFSGVRPSCLVSSWYVLQIQREANNINTCSAPVDALDSRQLLVVRLDVRLRLGLGQQVMSLRPIVY